MHVKELIQAARATVQAAQSAQTVPEATLATAQAQALATAAVAAAIDTGLFNLTGEFVRLASAVEGLRTTPA